MKKKAWIAGALVLTAVCMPALAEGESVSAIDGTGISTQAGENGAIALQDGIFVITPNQGYRTAQVIVDGTPISFTNYVDNELTAEEIGDAGEITVTFDHDPWKYDHCLVKAAATTGGTISGEGLQSVESGTDINYILTPDDGYCVEAVTVNGRAADFEGNTFVLKNVQKAMAVKVSFAAE